MRLKLENADFAPAEPCLYLQPRSSARGFDGRAFFPSELPVSSCDGLGAETIGWVFYCLGPTVLPPKKFGRLGPFHLREDIRSKKSGRRGYLLFHEDDVPYKIQITVHRSSFGIYLPEAYSPIRPYIHVEKRTTLLGTISERICCATEVLNTGEGGRSSFGTRKLSLVPPRLIRSDRLATVVSRWLCPPQTSQRGSRAGGAKPNPSQPFVRTSGGPPESSLLSLFPVSEALSPDPSEGVSDAHRPLSTWSVARASQQ